VIRVAGLSKTFRIYDRASDRLRELFFGGKRHAEHRALSDISFTVADGETLGIIGDNGAGKSTLLKILMGVVLPDAGTVEVAGRITGLLELGTGFNFDLSGRENIRTNGLLIGMTPEDIEARLESIIAFSELGEYIDHPLQTYSSGMLMRLGFSIAIHAEPECLLVDEALAVGDAYFQQKCMRAIETFKAQGGSILFISHDMTAVTALCDRAILLAQGRIEAEGEPKKVVDLYQARTLKRLHKGATDLVVQPSLESAAAEPALLPPHAQASISTGDVRLLGAGMADSSGVLTSTVLTGETVTFRFTVEAQRALDDPHFGIVLRNRFGQVVFETNTYCMKRTSAPLAAGRRIAIAFAMDCKLLPGEYAVALGVANRGINAQDFEEYLFLMNEAVLFAVLPNPESILFSGIVNLEPRFERHDVS
jgi:lipopolysaccharide transport system ATP-binding protein